MIHVGFKDKKKHIFFHLDLEYHDYDHQEQERDLDHSEEV